MDEGEQSNKPDTIINIPDRSGQIGVMTDFASTLSGPEKTVAEDALVKARKAAKKEIGAILPKPTITNPAEARQVLVAAAGKLKEVK